MSKRVEADWLRGRLSLGAATSWTEEEMRLVAELAYALAEQGRHAEAIEIFSGLVAVAPATSYFHSALGALKMRTGQIAEAHAHLDTALAKDPHDCAALANRGEVHMLLGDESAALRDLSAALRESEARSDDKRSVVVAFDAARARGLVRLLTERGS